MLIFNSNNNHQKKNNTNNIQHLLSGNSMPGKVLSVLLIRFLIPQIMVHSLKLSKDSGCSLAMAPGLLDVKRPMRQKGKREKWIIQVSCAFPPGFREKSPTFNFSCPQHFHHLFLSFENCWINEVNEVGRKITKKERMGGRRIERRRQRERKPKYTAHLPQVLQ